MDLKQRTEKALIWSFVDKFGQQIIYFVSGIILANLLMPGDYGKIGVLTIFIVLSNILIDSGFSSALIRKKGATDQDYSTIFFFNLIISVLFYFVLYFSAVGIASYFEIPDLISISRVLFLSIVFNSLGLIQQTRMFKEIRFTEYARINIVSLTISSAVAIWYAANGGGVWALVVQTLGLSILKTILLWAYGRWFPKFIFSFASIKEFLGYSANLLGTGILNAIFNNIYPLIIAKSFSTATVGFYTQAHKLQDIPSALIANIFRSVAFPVLSSINDDKPRLLRVFGKYIRTTAFFIFPIMMLLIVVANPLIISLITEKWSASVPMLQVLSVAGMFSPFIILYYDLFNTEGRSDINFKIEIAKKIFLVAAIAITLFYSDLIINLIWVWVAYTLLSLVATAIVSSRVAGYKVSLFVKDIAPYFFVALISAALSLTTYLFVANSWAQLVVVTLIFAISYIAIVAIFKMEIWLECLSLAKRKLGIKQ
ncbi:MAG: lipopolysaccharide biosynthesis protein [Bacteroidales bacterium]|nr:lipopolysaccharide biosynthesis protein [Bacteroidales bacterium]